MTNGDSTRGGCPRPDAEQPEPPDLQTEATTTLAGRRVLAAVGAIHAAETGATYELVHDLLTDLAATPPDAGQPDGHLVTAARVTTGMLLNGGWAATPNDVPMPNPATDDRLHTWYQAVGHVNRLRIGHQHRDGSLVDDAVSTLREGGPVAIDICHLLVGMVGETMRYWANWARLAAQFREEFLLDREAGAAGAGDGANP